MHLVDYFVFTFVLGMTAGYAFRGKENFLIRETVNEAIAEWTKAKQMAGTLNQDMKSGATKAASKL